MLRSHRREIVYEPSPPSTFLTFAIPFLLFFFNAKALSGRGGTFVVMPVMSILMKSYLIQIIIFLRVLIQTGTAS